MVKYINLLVLTFLLGLPYSLFIIFSWPTSCSFRVNSIPKTNNDTQKNLKLVVLVMSYMKGKIYRDAIRDTWMKKYRENASEVVVKFSIGTEGLSSQEVKTLTLEGTTYGDLLLLPHLHDSYNNLTRKVLESFVELDKRYNFTYLLKCDDDTFIVLDTILSELQQRRLNRNYYWGYHYKKAGVQSEGKWAEKKWFLCNTYLPYAAGGGYILSHDLVSRIVASSNDLFLYQNEDVSIGTWLSPYDIDRHHDERFKTHPFFSKCYDNQIVIAEKSVEEMFAMQRSLNDGRGICSLQEKKKT